MSTASAGDVGGRSAPAPEGDPLTALGPSFKAALAALRRLRGRERRHPGGLRDAQYSLLFGLGEREALSLGELAARADLSPAAATELVDELAGAGFVQRLRAERDRRVVLVSLTDTGRRVVAEQRDAHEPRWRAAFADFSDEELGAAVAVLGRLRQFFEELAEER
jgi:DNA-binding MarR family transcriptional regulator